MRHLFTFLTAVLITASVFLPQQTGAQTPEKMSYQAVIRNSSDALVSNTKVGMQISILQGAADGTAVYTETQTPTTNANGLVSIEIGGEAGFSIIDWTNDTYFIKTETDPEGGTNYTITGVSQLLSVPYALHAKTAETVTGALDETDPLFSQSTAKGITAADTARWNKASGSPDETDPVFAAWDKSTGIQISTSQVRGLENYIDEESDPVFKNSFAAWIKETDIAKLQNLSGKNSGDETNASIKAKLGITTLSGVNTGDQDLSELATKTALENSTAQLRSEIPDVSAFLTAETDPTFTSSEAAKITADDITNLENLSGVNTGDQDLSIFLTAETDPNFTSSEAAKITADDIANLENLSGVNTGDQDLSGFLTNEIDPQFTAWDKSTGIQISTSQVIGLDNYIETESDPVFNDSYAAQISYRDIVHLWGLSGINSGDETNESIKAKLGITTLSGDNTGDQDLSGLATKTALENSTAQLRSEIPDVSAFLTEETDPLFTGWDKDYADLINTPTTITTAQADAIVANTAKNSYPEADATKLAGIEVGAQVNVQADWDATTGDALILNKPEIPEAADGSETKITSGTNVSITGTGTTDSPYEISATGAAGSPTGTQAGQMQYWDGTEWVTVAAGGEGQVLTFTGGVPTWTTTAGVRDVQNPVTGAIWMDRNLGASRVATSRDDENSYGDLYQWGRGADWHQKRTSGTTSALSGSATPGHSDFIMSQSDPMDWLITQNDNLWQGVDGINNPCPDGYRLPTRAEWEAEIATWSVVGASGGINSHLKLPAAGARSVSGNFINEGKSGDYWSSTVSGTKSFHLTFWGGSTTGVITTVRAVGMSVRCIKD